MKAQVRSEPGGRALIPLGMAEAPPGSSCNGNLAAASVSPALAPATFVRPSDRIAPTATRYPAPSQPPHKERSGEGKLSELFVASMNQFFSIPRKVFEPYIHSYECLQKSC